MSSAICVNLDQSKILPSGNELSLYHKKIDALDGLALSYFFLKPIINSWCIGTNTRIYTNKRAMIALDCSPESLGEISLQGHNSNSDQL